MWKVYYLAQIISYYPLSIKLVGYDLTDASQSRFPYYGVPSVIAVNMILAGASGGIVAVIIAT